MSAFAALGTIVDWLGDEWKWLVTTGLAIYGAGLGVVNKGRQDRAEQREIEREKHQLKIRTGIATDDKGVQPPLLRVLLTNLGFRPITVLRIELAKYGLDDGGNVGFDYDREQYPPRKELPLTLAPDDAPAVFCYPLAKITADFTHVVVTNSHGIKHEWRIQEEFMQALGDVRSGKSALLEQHKQVVIERAQQAMRPTDRSREQPP